MADAGSRFPRIADVIPRLQLRGAEVFAQQLELALQDRYALELFTLTGASPAARTQPPGAESLTRHEGPAVGASRSTIARELSEAVTAFEPDVIVAHGGEPLRAMIRAKLEGIAPIIYLRVASVPPQLARGLRGAALRRAYAKVTAFVAVSDSLRDELVNDFAIDPAKVTVIPNGRPLRAPLTAARREALRAELGAGPEDLLVAWVGGMVPEKDPAAAIRVAGTVHGSRANVKFALIGSGPLASTLPPPGEGLCYQPARPDAPDVIAAADILLSTSITEGVPGVMVEALLAGVPVIAPDVGGIGELVTDGAGLLVPGGDTDALAGAIVRMATDPSLRASAAQGARRRGAAFEIGAIADRYDEVYRAVLARD